MFSKLPVSRNTQATGAKAEAYAARFLQRRGHKILSRNFHCRFGEIDLVTLDTSSILVFVEVRFRTTAGFATAAESVTLGKQAKLRKTAQAYLNRNSRFVNFPCRFDVLAIEYARDSGQFSLQWIQNAFC